METKFRHIGIVVNDIKKQLFFYEKLLNLEIYYHKTEKGAYIDTLIGKYKNYPEIYKLGKNNIIMIELLYFGKNKKNIKKLNHTGITHFALTVKNLYQLYLKMSKKNIKFVSKPLIPSDGKVKVCFCQDYEGNYIELVEQLK